jgi:c-di-GMP-binding flagellar brake protein YcgR
MSLTSDEPVGSDRRRPGRIVCERLDTSSGRVRDLSRTGAKLIVRSMFAPSNGDPRTLLFETAMGESVPFQSTVMWVRRVGLMQYEIGVQFDHLDELRKRQLAEIVSIYCKKTTITDAA